MDPAHSCRKAAERPLSGIADDAETVAIDWLWPVPDMAPACSTRPLSSEERTRPRFMSSRPSSMMRSGRVTQGRLPTPRGTARRSTPATARGSTFGAGVMGSPAAAVVGPPAAAVVGSPAPVAPLNIGPAPTQPPSLFCRQPPCTRSTSTTAVPSALQVPGSPPLPPRSPPQPPRSPPP